MGSEGSTGSKTLHKLTSCISILPIVSMVGKKSADLSTCDDLFLPVDRCLISIISVCAWRRHRKQVGRVSSDILTHCKRCLGTSSYNIDLHHL